MNPITPNPAGLCLLLVFAHAAPAGAADLRVPADHPTIQAAVDAADDGDTIHVAAGVHAEQVRIIRKSLTLVGQPGTILRATPGMEAAIPGDIRWQCVVFIHLAPDVVLRGLTFEGDQLADRQEHGMRGVAYYDSGGTVENCRFTGFREPGSSAVDRGGEALAVFNDLAGAPLYDFRIAGNTIIDCHSAVYMVGAPDKVSLNVSIENNVVRGVGPTGAYSPGGIAFAGFTLSEGMTATVTGNTIAGFSYNGGGEGGATVPFHLGILVRGGGLPDFVPVDRMRFEGNTFRDNDIHLALIMADQHEVVNNRIEGSGEAERQGGVVFSGKDVLVQGNEFRGMPVGIEAIGDEDPQFGDMLGIAVNGRLRGNRFCEVDTRIRIQPSATATEAGTLVCPFPAPELAIEPAVLLSWPSYFEGWSVQGSSNLEDWSFLDVPVRADNGRFLLSVPATAPDRFFRLVESAEPPLE